MSAVDDKPFPPNPFFFSPFQQADATGLALEGKESHWRDSDPRPTPYHGVAIPLSHSGIWMTAGEHLAIRINKLLAFATAVRIIYLTRRGFARA